MGTALKTLTLRLRGSKTELEEMGEDVSDMATTTSQLQAKLLALTGGQVDIMLDENTFKNSTQILREMAEAWEDMDDISRASALELMGGKRQANVLSALIQNFDTVEDVIKTSANSAGSALEENERYLDSIQGKIDQFNNAVQSMWSNFLDSDVVKFIVDLGTRLVKLVDFIKPINVAAIGLIAVLEKKYGLFSNFFSPPKDGIEEWRKQLEQAKKELKKAEAADARQHTNKTFETKENAKKRVNELKEKVQPYDDVDGLKALREELLEEKHTTKLVALGKDQAKAELDALAEKQAEAQKKVNQAKLDVIWTLSGFSPTPLSIADANLKDAERELNEINAQLERTQQDLDGINMAEQRLVQINSELDYTNKELAEAEMRLSAIDGSYTPSISQTAPEANPELDALIGDRDTLSQEVDAMKAKREELKKAVEAESPDDMLKLVEIDTASIDDEIAEAKEKLESAKQDLLNAQNEPATKKVNGGIRMNPERDKRISNASQEIAEIEKDLDALQQKKVETVRYAAQFDLAEMDEAIGEASEKLEGMTSAINERTAAQTANVAATSAEIAADRAATASSNERTAATLADVWAEVTRTGATGASVAATFKQVLATKLANSELVKKGIAILGVTAAEGASIPITTMLAAGFVGLAASIGAATLAMLKFMFTTPIGLILTAVLAVAAFIKWGNTAANLREELTDLKSEISSIKDEIDSLNSELETTQERMAELLAKDSLSFTEQEELENLQKQNDLLEREIYLLEQREKRLQADAQKTFDKLMGKNKNLGSADDDEVSDRSLERKMRKYEKWAQEYENAKQALVKAEQSGNERDIKQAEKRLEKAEKKMNKKQDKVSKELDQYLEDAEGIDYESADAKTKKYLDYIYNTEGRYNIASGDSQAKSVEIKRIFNKDAMSDVKDEIDELVKKLAKNPDDQNIIAQISKQCKLAEGDLKAVGLSVQDATNYFTQLGSNASFDTIEGKVAEIQTATSRLQTLLSNTKSTDFANLFDKDGKVLETAVAEYFKGTSEATRAEISKLVKNINDGEISVEDALKTFELFSVQSIIDIQVKEVQTNFKDVFTDLEDADGLVDTFKELGEAINSTVGAMEAFNQAQADIADKGFVSIQTALQLMEYTDDYGSVLQVVDGKLQLAENAEQNLIQARIDALKVSAQTAVADAQSAYDKAQLAVTSYRSAMVEEASASTVATAWQKIVAVAAGIKNALDNIFSGESVGDLYNSGYNSYLEAATGYETSYDDAGLQALEDALTDAGKKLNEAKDNAEIVNIMTPENLEDLYKSSDKSSPEEVADEAFQKEMDYWENRIAANQAKYEQLQNEIDLLEAKGQKADASFYERQIELEKQRLELLNGQKAAAKAHLATLEEGSEEWWEVANTLNDIESELDDVTASILDLQDAIGEIDTYKFEEFNTRVSNLADQLEAVRNLLADEDEWFNDEGEWTEDGVAALATYIQELEIYKNALGEAEEELTKYQAAYAGNEAYYETLGIHSEQEYYDKLTEARNQYGEYLGMIDDMEDAVVDMYESQIDAVEEWADEAISAYEDYIDVVKESLNAERDLYDFKKKVQNESKNISALERKIASLSGSTNKSDIAERRKLEAELYSARESLNDTYYDHAQQSQEDALDKEAEAYTESMNNMIEGLRISLEEATTDMDTFLMGVTTMVTYNAETVLDKYKEANPRLTSELTNPWEEAKKATEAYSGNALDLMNQWTKDNGFFAQFNSTGTTNLQSPWSAGVTAATNFQTDVGKVMTDVTTNISSNVKTASDELSKLYQQILDTENRAANVGVDLGSGDDDNLGRYKTPTTVSVSAKLNSSGKTFTSTKTASDEASAQKAAKDAVIQQAYDYYSSRGYDDAWLDKKWSTWNKSVSYYAKGTTCTTRDEWAITDELGPELILHADPTTGRLQYLTKGSGVVTADATAELMKLADIGVDGLMMPKFDSGVSMMTNYITKPEFKIDIEEFVHVDRVDQDTLPKLEAMMDKKIDTFAKQLNYSIKKFSR